MQCTIASQGSQGETIPQKYLQSAISSIQKENSLRICYGKDVIESSIIDTCYYGKDTAVTVLGILPLKKMTFQMPLCNKNLLINDATNSWIIHVSIMCDTLFYKYDMFRPNSVELMSCICKQNMFYIFNTDSIFLTYFRDEVRPLNPNFFFWAKQKDHHIVLHDICTNEKYSVDSLILLKYGSYAKYAEIMQDEEQKKITLLEEVPKTIEDALEVLKRDYNEYFLCYPNDTISAAIMLINEVAAIARIDAMQERLLKQRATNAIKKLNNKQWSDTDYDYVLSLITRQRGIHGIFVGQLDFYYIIQSVLTKAQINAYVEYYTKQQVIRDHIIYSLVKPFFVDNEFRDFLRKEVYKK
jgi:hypothetical protein